MKVLLLATHINIGGIGVYTFNLAKYLRKKNIEVIVVSGGGELEDPFREEDIRHIRLDMRTKSEFGIKMWKNIPALIRIIRDEKIELVHAQTRVTQVMGCIAEKFTGIPYVSTCHGFYKYNRISRRMFPCWGRKIIAISKSVERHLLDDFMLPEGTVDQIYNGIEVDRFACALESKGRELIRKIGVSGKITVIGSVGRFSPVKGYKYLIRAFKILIENYPEIRLFLVGDEGPALNNLKTQVDREGLADKVFFDHATVPDLENYLGVMDIFCLPSLDEGLGLSMMEAMAAGCACVGSDVGGISELIIDGEDGLLARPADEKHLAERISCLLEDPERAREIARKAGLKAKEKFSITESVDKTIKVYEEAVCSGRGRRGA